MEFYLAQVNIAGMNAVPRLIKTPPVVEEPGQATPLHATLGPQALKTLNT